MTRDVSDADRRTVLQGLAATGALALVGNTTAQDEPTTSGRGGGSSVLTPVYRLYDADNVNHFYTTSESERDDAANNGYRKEGVVGYSPTE